MRALFVGVAFALIALAVIPLSHAARADNQVGILQISCVPGGNFFEIRDIGSLDIGNLDTSRLDKLIGLVAGSTHDLTEKGHALYSPVWAYYRPDIPVDVQEKTTDRESTLHITRFECTLPASTVELKIVPVFSGIRYGGAVRDIMVSLRVADHWVVKNVPFEPCEDRGPITRLAYEGAFGTVRFEGRFGGVWPDKVSSSEAWDNRQRRYLYRGAKLVPWDTIQRDRKALPIPLTMRDLDYFEDRSSYSYGRAVTDCY